MPGQIRSRPNVARMTIHTAIRQPHLSKRLSVRRVDAQQDENTRPRGDDHGVTQIGIVAGPPMNTVCDKGQCVERLGHGADEEAGQQRGCRAKSGCRSRAQPFHKCLSGIDQAEVPDQTARPRERP